MGFVTFPANFKPKDLVSTEGSCVKDFRIAQHFIALLIVLLAKKYAFKSRKFSDDRKHLHFLPQEHAMISSQFITATQSKQSIHVTPSCSNNQLNAAIQDQFAI